MQSSATDGWLGRSRDRVDSFPSSYRTVEDFVTTRGGTRAIKKVLVANNGIAAVKFIRSVRKWAYETFGNEREVRSAPPLQLRRCRSRCCGR